jgi:hypothetical protein
MRVRGLVVAFFALVSCTTTNAVAQEKGQTGLTMGYPATIGLIWHVSDTMALRPEFSFSRASNELSSSTPPAASSSTGTGEGVALSGLFYLRKWESVGAYFSPRYAYSHSSTSSQSVSGSNSTNTSSTHSVTGSIGVQYSVNRRFGVFGEAGFGYTRQNSHSSLAVYDNKGNAWATRTAIGAILYF